MNEKIWATVKTPIEVKSHQYVIPEGTFVRIMPWLTQREFGNVKIEYISNTGSIHEVFVKEAWLEKLTDEEVSLLDFFYEPW